MSEAADQTANTFWLRYAQPVGRWLVRLSLPVSRLPAGDGTTASGLGRLQRLRRLPVQDQARGELRRGTADHRPHRQRGRDRDREVAGWPRRHLLQRHVAGDAVGRARHLADGLRRRRRTNGNERPRRCSPSISSRLGKGLYARSTAIAVFDLENDTYNVPVGTGHRPGRPDARGTSLQRLRRKLQFTVLAHGAGQPELQIFIGFNTQFVKR